MARLRLAAKDADTAVLAAQFSAQEAERAAERLQSHFQEISDKLKIIEAKRLLKIRLNTEERAIWTLYGKQTKN